MNTKSLTAFVAILAFTLHCPAQQPQAPAPNPAARPTPIPVPQVTVNLLGEFNAPQRVNLPKGSGLLDALGAAGGLSHQADPRKVIIIHKSPGGMVDNVKIDLLPIMQGRVKDITLRDGDTVVIGQSLF